MGLILDIFKRIINEKLIDVIYANNFPYHFIPKKIKTGLEYFFEYLL